MIWLVLVAVVFVGGGAWFVAKSMKARLIVAGVGLAAVAGYWFVGQPSMYDDPLDGRLEQIEERAKRDPGSLSTDEQIALAELRIRQHPEDAMLRNIMAKLHRFKAEELQTEGMQLRAEAMQSKDEAKGRKAATLLGQAEKSIRDALNDYNEAVSRNPNLTEALSGYADLRFNTTGEVDPFTTQLYQAAYTREPDNLRLGYFAGVGLWLQGKKDEAEALWADANAKAPADGPELRMFKALRGMFGIDPAPAAPAAPAKPPG